MFSVCKFIEREHQYYIHTRKMPGFLSRKLINFVDTRKTLVDMTANTHFVEMYSKGTLELHTYQKDARISFENL